MTSQSTQTGSECWISDMGEQTELHSDDGSVMTLPRYGVWTQDRCRRRPGVIEVSDDLQGLMQKYGVPKERVFNLKRENKD